MIQKDILQIQVKKFSEGKQSEKQYLQRNKLTK